MLSVQFSSVTQSCPTLCNPMNHSTPGLPVHHQLPTNIWFKFISHCVLQFSQLKKSQLNISHTKCYILETNQVLDCASSFTCFCVYNSWHKCFVNVHLFRMYSSLLVLCILLFKCRLSHVCLHKITHMSIKYTMDGTCEIKYQVKYTFVQPLCDHGTIISLKKFFLIT